MKEKTLAIFLLSLFAFSIGCAQVYLDNNSGTPSPSPIKHEEPKLYINYPHKAEEKITYGNFPHFPTNYSVVANITSVISNHHIKVHWDFIIDNRSKNTTIIYIKAPNSGKLNMTLQGEQVNLSKLSAYLLLAYNAKIIPITITFPKNTSIHGKLEYETSINSSFTQYILGDFVKFSPIYYPENYPSIIVFSTEWLLPISPAGVLLNSNSLYNPIPRMYNLTVILPPNYTVLSDHYLPKRRDESEKLVVTFKNIEPNPTDYRFIYIYNQSFFRRAEITIKDAKLIVYTPKKSYLDFQKLTNATAQIFRHHAGCMEIVPYQEVHVFFDPDLTFGEAFNDSRKGTAIVGFHARGEIDTLRVTSHELAHIWFGLYESSGRIDESFATLMELDSHNITNGDLNMEENLVLKHSSCEKPLAQIYKEGISDPNTRNAMQYFKGAFVFRSLQFVLGDETFFGGLRELLKDCHGKECNLTDVQNVFERVSGQNLDWFFKEWFYTAKVPDYEVENLSLEEKNGKYFLTFEIIDKNNFTMPLEVKVKTPTKSFIKKVWVNKTAKVEFELDEKPTKIILDPNEWMTNENREYDVEKVWRIGKTIKFKLREEVLTYPPSKLKINKSEEYQSEEYLEEGILIE